jgi:hypothetical protein
MRIISPLSKNRWIVWTLLVSGVLFLLWSVYGSFRENSSGPLLVFSIGIAWIMAAASEILSVRWKIVGIILRLLTLLCIPTAMFVWIYISKKS